MSDNQVPKCVRVMTTLIYADGSSVIVDIKDPDSVETVIGELRTRKSVYSTDSLYLFLDEAKTFGLNVEINNIRPVIFSTHPVKD